MKRARLPSTAFLLLLCGCYSQATIYNTEFDWDNRARSIAVVPSDNQDFDNLIVETLKSAGYRNVFIPPTAGAVQPPPIKADLTLRTHRLLHSIENSMFIQEAHLWITDTRPYAMGGPIPGDRRILYQNTCAGDAPYTAEGMKTVIRGLLDPLLRNLRPY